MGGIGKVVLQSIGALVGSALSGFAGSEPIGGTGTWACNCCIDGGTGGSEFWTGMEPELPGIIVACP